MQNFNFTVIEKIFYPQFNSNKDYRIEQKTIAQFANSELAKEYVKFKSDFLSKTDLELKFEYIIQSVNKTITV